MTAVTSWWRTAQEVGFARVNQRAVDTPFLHAPVSVYARFGVVAFAGLLLLAWWVARRAPDPARVAAAPGAPLAALLALDLNQALVAGEAEPRPWTAFPDALVLLPRSSDYAFPSDHAVMAGAVAAGAGVAVLSWLVARGPMTRTVASLDRTRSRSLVGAADGSVRMARS